MTEGWRERGHGPPEAQTAAPGTTPRATPGGLRNSWSGQRAGTVRGSRTREQPRPTRARHSAAERDGALTGTPWRSLENAVLGERGQAKRPRLRSPTDVKCPHRRIQTENRSVVAWGCRKRGRGSRTGSPFGVTEKPWDRTVGTAVCAPEKSCEYAEHHLTAHCSEDRPCNVSVHTSIKLLSGKPTLHPQDGEEPQAGSHLPSPGGGGLGSLHEDTPACTTSAFLPVRPRGPRGPVCSFCLQACGFCSTWERVTSVPR